jgi:glycosyltransferase involved in cell wall biosynthesis
LAEHQTGYTFSVIIPTSGRASLRRTLKKLRDEDVDDIEVLVVADGTQARASLIASEEAKRWPAIRYCEGPLTRSWGNAQRMAGIEQATGRYLMFIDDDDVTKRRAFGAIREAVCRDPGRMILFRVKRHGEILWKRPEIAFSNVSTQQVVVPNLPGKVGSWLTNDRYQSDFDFIRECADIQGEPIWNTHIIAVVDAFRWTEARAWLVPRMRRSRNHMMLRTRMRRLVSRRTSRRRSDRP